MFPKTIILDAENCLFPANELYCDALNISLAEVTRGKSKIKQEQFQSLVAGKTYEDIVEFAANIKPSVTLSKEQIQQLYSHFMFRVDSFLNKGTRTGPRKEHLDLLKWLKELETQIIICSNMDETILMKYLEATGYQQYVDFVITPNQTNNDSQEIKPKPNVQMYKKIIDFYNLLEHEILCVEGTLFGATAASLSSLNFICCKNPELLTLESFKKACTEMELLVLQ